MSTNKKKKLKKYLDLQIEERKKEDDFLKSLDDKEARIWTIDYKKYLEIEKIIEAKIKAMNKTNLGLLKIQFKQKKRK